MQNESLILKNIFIYLCYILDNIIIIFFFFKFFLQPTFARNVVKEMNLLTMSTKCIVIVPIRLYTGAIIYILENVMFFQLLKVNTYQGSL